MSDVIIKFTRDEAVALSEDLGMGDAWDRAHAKLDAALDPDRLIGPDDHPSDRAIAAGCDCSKCAA